MQFLNSTTRHFLVTLLRAAGGNMRIVEEAMEAVAKENGGNSIREEQVLNKISAMTLTENRRRA